MTSWIVTTVYDGETVAPVATRLYTGQEDRYPKLTLQVAGNGTVTTGVRMDDMSKDEAIAGARERLKELVYEHVMNGPMGDEVADD